MNTPSKFKFGHRTVRWFLFLILISPSLARAQQYSIDWFTVDGGGGASSNGQYTITGTIGQPDAGHLAGGNYTLDGGFWGVIAVVPTPGAPSLRIAKAGPNTVLLAWPAPSTGFSLQQNAALGTTNWSGVTNSVAVVGTENQVLISPSVGNRFYRLTQ
jgi:hypothetical protein